MCWRPRIRQFCLWGWVTICLAALTACGQVGLNRTGAAPDQRFDRFALVTPASRQTLASVADQQLGDPSQAWLLAKINPDAPRLIVPRKPLYRGGLYPEGYQVVPVLAYHNFSHTHRAKMKILARTFESQMRYLRDNGFQVIPLDHLYEFLAYQRPLPPKAVVITIDDGWRAIHDIAAPILQRFGYPATIFVYTDFIGGPQAMSWDQVRALSTQGFDIQCHSKSHRNLTQPGEGENFAQFFKALEAEVVSAKRQIEAQLKTRCKYMAYPYGKTNALVVAMLQKHGYSGGLTVQRGSNAFDGNPYRVKRSVIYGHYDLTRFQQNLTVFEKMDLR